MQDVTVMTALQGLLKPPAVGEGSQGPSEICLEALPTYQQSACYRNRELYGEEASRQERACCKSCTEYLEPALAPKILDSVANFLTQKSLLKVIHFLMLSLLRTLLRCPASKTLLDTDSSARSLWDVRIMQ